KPRVARNELPWGNGKTTINPNGVVTRTRNRAATPLGLIPFTAISQGSSFLATLGFGSESLWDSQSVGTQKVVGNLQSKLPQSTGGARPCCHAVHPGVRSGRDCKTSAIGNSRRHSQGGESHPPYCGWRQPRGISWYLVSLASE